MTTLDCNIVEFEKSISRLTIVRFFFAIATLRAFLKSEPSRWDFPIWAVEVCHESWVGIVENFPNEMVYYPETNEAVLFGILIVRTPTPENWGWRPLWKARTYISGKQEETTK